MINLKNTYNIEDILHKYPRCKDKINNWFLEQVLNVHRLLAKEAGTEIESELEKIRENKEQVFADIPRYLTYNGRDLYDFFDENEIYLEPYQYGKKFGVSTQEMIDVNNFNSRWEAECAAFNEAFKVLEAKF